MNLEKACRSQLMALARRSIELGLERFRWVAMPALELPLPLFEARGSYVTLRTRQRLRGSCGSPDPDHSLAESVWRNAWAAAFADPRFAPLVKEEWSEMQLHLSILSPLEDIPAKDEADLVQILSPGIDGLILEREASRATFLPEVWEQLPDPIDFVRHLKQKAGWPATSWSPEIRIRRFTAESFSEFISDDAMAAASLQD
jgi:AmmeMemoRadiSam system protein A